MNRLAVAGALAAVAAVVLVAEYFIVSAVIHGPMGSATDSPVVVRGGSVSTVATQKWTPGTPPNIYSTTTGGFANTLNFDGLSTNPASFTISNLKTNWEVTLTFTNNPATQLQICTYLQNNACAVNGNPVGKTVYLVTNPNDTVIPDSVGNPNTHMHFKLYHCNYSDPPNNPDPDPACNHVKTVTILGTPKNNGNYQCVNWACDVGVDQK